MGWKNVSSGNFWASVQDHYVKSEEKGFQMFRDLTMFEDSHQWIFDKDESLFIGAFCWEPPWRSLTSPLGLIKLSSCRCQVSSNSSNSAGQCKASPTHRVNQGSPGGFSCAGYCPVRLRPGEARPALLGCQWPSYSGGITGSPGRSQVKADLMSPPLKSKSLVTFFLFFLN